MLRIHYFILGLVLLLTAACGDMEKSDVATDEAGATVETQNNEAAPETQKAEPAPEPRKAAPAPETRRAASKQRTAAPRQETPPAPPQPRYATLSAGTVIPVRLQDSLDTAVNKTGDVFRAVVDQDLVVGNSVVVPRGSLVEGKLTQVERSGRVKGRAAMSLQFISLNVGNQAYPLQSEILSFEAEGTKKKDAAKVGIGSGIGAVVGAIAGGGKGAAIGAAVGAGAGGATVVATRGEELKFSPEHQLEFTLDKDLQIRIR